ncbi:tripartite motif-containing protein 2-like isoform X1 [Oncorhynchus keta]|uniref:tripartite motif-containing protein 2-like isoform X1 n=2 Tax=Oncorhynchus keta TaxID=8018 RepID=UPI00227B88F8|nr:tripartite motif-containing protein 2-like isoform X1 [Oncorhynchus keta]XP_052314993.1 tripartite motif-containing protein 2-like isoform X1 [Oncorhynchus keta]XP_052314994.1 tripartite motif-containing protein 2-like isoform X1 [Oncorhynchus keta]XP_052314995.1 tripartite motif-containing protein 2-like isoform X1 [Oncorhynchus keta]XP_052314996.1 tripartite motif-containing protein 2-like isoform X1 [Oncorhynchus keta]XP_052314997.1 tripartite motif-containing protein 2-like isoform X1 [
MEGGQPSPDSSSEECKVLEALPDKGLACHTHTGKVTELYCSGCEVCVCEVCVSGEHADHPTLPLLDFLETHRDGLQERLTAAQNRLPQISEALVSLREILKQLTNQRDLIEEDIHVSFEELHKTLDVRKSVLLMELEVTYGLKQKVLQAQLDTLLQGHRGIADTCSQTEEALSGKASAASLQAERGLGERLGELASQGLPFQAEENDQLDLVMEAEGLRKSIHNLGTIVTTSAVASQSEASGVGLEQCIVGLPACVTITTRDKAGGHCRTGNAILSAEVCTPDGSVADGEILDHKNGTYDFVYTVNKEGEFSLALRLYDQHIKGSPFSLRVTRSPDPEVSPPTTTATSLAATATPSTGSSEGAKRRGKSPGSGSKKKGSRRTGSALGTPRRKENPIEDDLIFRIGTKGKNKGEFTNLQGVSTSSNGRILIADSNNQCVQIFSNDGEFKSRFGVRGRSPGQLQRPTGVAVHPNGDIIIADYDNKWVSIFSSEGKYKAKLGSGRLMGPKGVSVDQNGHVIVVDNKACTVFIFQPTGKLVTKFGSRGNGDKQFAGPHFAAVNNNNEIIVTDFHNHSVKVFTPEGELLLKFGSNGEGNGQFNAPTGVAVDVNGNIIVADWGNSRIQVFDGSGSFLSYINTSADPLYGPQGLALTSDGHVVVADSGNHCFKVYRYLQ